MLQSPEESYERTGSPCSLCTSHFGGLGLRPPGPPQGPALPCSKGLAMVTSWASCCSQENCASDHFTRSWGAWPWTRKHWGKRDRHNVQLRLPVPPTQKCPSTPPQQQALGRLWGLQNQDTGVSWGKSPAPSRPGAAGHTQLPTWAKCQWEGFFGPPKAPPHMGAAPGPSAGRADRVCLAFR